MRSPEGGGLADVQVPVVEPPADLPERQLSGIPVTAVKRCTRTPATITANKKPNVVFNRARKEEKMPQQDVKKLGILFFHVPSSGADQSIARTNSHGTR
jgi:hypothetical protein